MRTTFSPSMWPSGAVTSGEDWLYALPSDVALAICADGCAAGGHDWSTEPQESRALFQSLFVEAYSPQCSLPAQHDPHAGPIQPALNGSVWLDCTGDLYDSVWDDFYDVVKRFVVLGDVDGRAKPLAMDIIARAEKWYRNRTGEELAGPMQLTTFLEDVLVTNIADTERAQRLNGLCYGGVFTAFAVFNSFQEYNVGCNPTDDVHLALAHMFHARSMLGHRFQLDIFAAGSRWNFFDTARLYVWIQTEIGPTGTLACPSRLNLPWPDELQLEDPEALAARDWALTFQPPRRQPEQIPLQPIVCHWTFFHLGVVLNSVLLVQAAMLKWPIAPVHRIFHDGLKSDFNETHGSGPLQDYVEEWCVAIGGCTEDQVIRAWAELLAMSDERLPELETMLSPEAFLTMRAAANEAGHCDIIVSEQHVSMQVLLRHAYPEASLLAIISDNILPATATDTEAWTILEFSRELFLRPRSPGRLIMTCEKLALQTYWQTGYLARTAPAPMLHIFPLARRRYDPQDHNGRLLVYGRAILSQRVSFLHTVLSDLIAANPNYPFGFTLLVGPLNYKEWPKFAATMVLPWNLHALTLMEMYALNMPLFMPRGALPSDEHMDARDRLG